MNDETTAINKQQTTNERINCMKKLMTLAIAVLFIAGMATVALADQSGNAVSSVYVQVVPNVSILASTPLVDLGSIQTGQFSAALTWRVDANMEAVRFFIEASNLYKGDNPLDTTVAPIPVATSMPASIIAQFGNEMNAGDNKAEWGSAGSPIGNYPTVTTETVSYESSQNGHFSQNVVTTIYYNQPDPEQPTGQYSGKIRLTILL